MYIYMYIYIYIYIYIHVCVCVGIENGTKFHIKTGYLCHLIVNAYIYNGNFLIYER